MLTTLGRGLRKFCPFLRAWCPVFPNRIIILSDGNVTTCCRDWRGDNVFGSIYSQDIDDLWRDHVNKIVCGDLWDLKMCQECIGGKTGIMMSWPFRYKAWRSLLSKPYPSTLQIEVMAACNYACCGIHKLTQYRKFLKADLNKAFEQIKPCLNKIERLLLFNGGSHYCMMDFVSLFISAASNQINFICFFPPMAH